MSVNSYEVYVPIEGYMKIYLVANDPMEAAKKAKEIAMEIRNDGGEQMIPNLNTWKINQDKTILIGKKGEIDG